VEYKRKVVNMVNIEKLFDIIDNHSGHLPVATTCAGLFANLAVDDGIADKCTELGVIGVISHMLDHEFDDQIFSRNVVTALSNLMTSPLYRQECIRFSIPEKLYELKESTRSWAIISLMLNCLVTIGVPVTEQTTSYHLAAKYGLTDILREMIHKQDEEIDFSMVDPMGVNLLGYARQNPNSNEAMIYYLLMNGAKIEANELEQLPMMLKLKIDDGYAKVAGVRKRHIQALHNTSGMNYDLSTFIVKNLSNHALLGQELQNEILIG